MYSSYKLNKENYILAAEKGLAAADWYTSPVPREEMRNLLKRNDRTAIKDTLLWFALLGTSGYLGFYLWGSWWAILAFAFYGVMYASVSDSRWHESLHGTAFKTDWMNDFLYEISAFMVFRQSTPWRWSHTRHHSDTSVKGLDPELAVPRPPNIAALLRTVINGDHAPAEFKKMLLHSLGQLTPEEKMYIPESDYRRVYIVSRIYLAIYSTVIFLAIYHHTFLPLMFIGFPTFYGVWLQPIFGLTQHTALAENELDHRLNCRTIYMNPVSRYLYWEMNYHTEHHMFPLVPFHALSKLHEIVKDDLPKTYHGIIEAYREIIPAVLKQCKDPSYYIKQSLPTPSKNSATNVNVKMIVAKDRVDSEGWLKICSADELKDEDVLRFDTAEQTYAIYRNDKGNFYATEGVCTHGNTHLAEGMVIGNQIECPKHNGRFDVSDGCVKRNPVCVGLKTFPVKNEHGALFLNTQKAGGAGIELSKDKHTFSVISNHNVSTYIKELILQPMNETSGFEFKSGEYIQLDIPVYKNTLKNVDISSSFRKAWEDDNLFEVKAECLSPIRRNYSLANNPSKKEQLHFNIRIAPPPQGLVCNAGKGSSYVFNLKPGDEVTALGPFGDFHIKESENEMIYLGGGAGMAPLKSHISYLFDTLNTKRKVSFWYGARSSNEIFYLSYFEKLAEKYENFEFNIALSESVDEESHQYKKGFIHDSLNNEYLSSHQNIASVEFYLCGPPAMMNAAKTMLAQYNVNDEQIAFDEF